MHLWDLEYDEFLTVPKDFNAFMEVQAAVTHSDKQDELLRNKVSFSMPVLDSNSESRTPTSLA